MFEVITYVVLYAFGSVAVLLFALIVYELVTRTYDKYKKR